MDYGHQYADKKISAVDRELKKTYRTAQKQLKEKLADFEKQFARKNKEKKKKLDAGEITQDEYRQWMTGQVFVRSRWQEQQRMINAVLLDHNRQAMNIVQNSTFDVFAENYNYNAYLAEQKMVGTFNLYNAEAVARLILGDPKLLPEWDIDKKKDYTWNQQKVNNILRQSIIQGKGIDEITQDLADGLATKNYNRMRLFARTAITEAENAGRQQQMNDAAEMGIEVKKMWIATHDNRTRDAHRELDGDIVPYDQPFHSALGDIQRPGDPDADPANVYNCRCCMRSIYPKYDQGTTREETIDGQSYEEWKKGKKKRGEVVDSTAPKKLGKDFSEGMDTARMRDILEWNGIAPEEIDKIKDNEETLRKEINDLYRLQEPWLDEETSYRELIDVDNLSYTEVEEKWEAISSKLTPEEDRAQYGYVKNPQSFDINNALRHSPSEPLNEVFTGRYQDRRKVVNDMDSIISKNSLSHDSVLTRMVDDSYTKSVLGMDHLQLGDVIKHFRNPEVQKGLQGLIGTKKTEYGFMSTMGADAKDYQAFNVRNVKLRILADEGTPALITNPSELEVILGRNTEYEITRFGKSIVTEKRRRGSEKLIVEVKLKNKKKEGAK